MSRIRATYVTNQNKLRLTKTNTPTIIYRSFEAHPLMQPPSVNSTAFFLFDFIRNTHRLFKSIDAEKFQSSVREDRDKAQEVLERNQFANLLVSDTTGKLALMTGGDPRNPVDFGDEIRQRARALVEI